jgi:hypothetical protein
LAKKISLKSGLELLLSRKYLTLQYMEDNYVLESIELNDENYFKDLKVLLFGEIIEIYIVQATTSHNNSPVHFLHKPIIIPSLNQYHPCSIDPLPHS